MLSLNDSSDMTTAVYHGCKAKKKNNNNALHTTFHFNHSISAFHKVLMLGTEQLENTTIS